VHVRCRGQNIHIYSDSLASYGGRVIQFIGTVRYRDSSTTLDADFGTYFKDGEHFDAQGNVDHKDLRVITTRGAAYGDDDLGPRGPAGRQERDVVPLETETTTAPVGVSSQRRQCR